MNHFLPCTGCARHVQARDPICPFCGEALPMSLRSNSIQAIPSRRLGRAATFAFGAALAASTACSGGVDGADGGPADAAAMIDSGGGGADAGGADAGDADGGADAGPDDTDAGSDAGPDGTDAGSDAAVEVDAGFDAGGGITPLYGGVPLLDGGLTRSDAGPIDAGGGITPLYGGSPPS